MIYTICYRTCGNPFDAEDLTQEVYIAAYRNLSTFDRSYERAWLSKIAANKCLDYLKSAKRREVPAEEETFLPLQDARGTPEETYLQKESKERVNLLCERLKEPYRTVAKEHFYLEKSTTEIAAEQGKSVKTVQTQIYRAKAMLKKAVKEGRHEG